MNFLQKGNKILKNNSDIFKDLENCKDETDKILNRFIDEKIVKKRFFPEFEKINKTFNDFENKFNEELRIDRELNKQKRLLTDEMLENLKVLQNNKETELRKQIDDSHNTLNNKIIDTEKELYLKLKEERDFNNQYKLTLEDKFNNLQSLQSKKENELICLMENIKQELNEITEKKINILSKEIKDNAFYTNKKISRLYIYLWVSVGFALIAVAMSFLIR